MKTPLHSTVPLLLPVLLSALAPLAFAFPATRENADLTLNFTLSPLDPLSTAAGTASIHVTRLNGTETDDPIDLTLSGLADGTYSVEATTKSDPMAAPVVIGSVTVSSIPDPSAPPPAPLTLPDGLSALDIATLTISDVTPAVVLAGGPSEDVAKWHFFANRPLRAPDAIGGTSVAPVSGTPTQKKLHGHVIIHAVITDAVELRRKLLLVGHGLPPETVLTVNLDGVPVGDVTTTKHGKAMLKSLDGDFRLAGTQLLTLSDPDGNVVAEADFFPDIE